MGIFDALFYEKEDKNKSSKEVQQKVEPLVTNNNNINTNTNIVGNDNMFGSTTTNNQPIITEADKAKWQNYFTNIYKVLKDKCINYGKFLSNIEIVNDTDATLPDANKFKMAFGFMKKNGISKEMLLQSTQDAINMVENDKNSVFDPTIQSKNNDIQNNIRKIEEKKASISKLSDEIAQLEKTNVDIKQQITIDNSIYTTLSSQLVSKIKNDIQNISNFI